MRYRRDRTQGATYFFTLVTLGRVPWLVSRGAVEQLRQAFRAEMALRDAHWEMVDRVMGLVRSAFPLDKDVHDVIFPIVTDDSPKRESSGEEIEKAPVSVGTA